MKRIVMVMALVACGAVLTLAACGKKEPVKPPEGATYPHQYPAPS